jgi:hypothetical protein
MLPFRLLLCSDERTSRDAERESGLPPDAMAGINRAVAQMNLGTQIRASGVSQVASSPHSYDSKTFN